MITNWSCQHCYQLSQGIILTCILTGLKCHLSQLKCHLRSHCGTCLTSQPSLLHVMTTSSFPLCSACANWWPALHDIRIESPMFVVYGFGLGIVSLLKPWSGQPVKKIVLITFWHISYHSFHDQTSRLSGLLRGRLSQFQHVFSGIFEQCSIDVNTNFLE